MTSGKAVTKAVIPAAGLGTRFLPATKAMPKEMLPVVDQPAIQYVVEEAVRAGLTDLLMITGRQKRALEDHFDRVPALEATLANLAVGTQCTITEVAPLPPAGTGCQWQTTYPAGQTATVQGGVQTLSVLNVQACPAAPRAVLAVEKEVTVNGVADSNLSLTATVALTCSVTALVTSL